MYFLDEPLRKIFLHESIISKVTYENSQLTFFFKQGFWNDKHEQLKNCRLIFKIKDLEVNNISGFVRIRKNVVKKRYVLSKEITFSQFEDLLKGCEFIVESEYYSEFERAMLIVGWISKYEMEIKITDIDELAFSFE